MTTGDFLFFPFFSLFFFFFLSFFLPPLSRSFLFTHSHRLEKFFVFVSLSFLSFRTIGLFFPSHPSWAPKFSPPRGCWAHTEVADGVTSSLRFWLVTQRCRSTGTPGSAGVALAGAGGVFSVPSDREHVPSSQARSHPLGQIPPTSQPHCQAPSGERYTTLALHDPRISCIAQRGRDSINGFACHPIAQRAARWHHDI